jgi:RHS repeat-associated protein
MTNYSGSVWIDDQPVLSNVPLNTDLDVQRSPEISLSGNPGIPVKVWIDDLDVKFLDRSMILQDSAEVVFRPLFRDNFNRYERALFPRQGGWMPGQDLVDGYGISQGKTAQEGGVVSEKATPEILMSGSTIDDAEYASSSKSFKLEDPDNEAGLVVKRFSLPVRTPFCVSAENFAISAVNQDSRGDDNRIGLSGRERVDEREGRRGAREESKAGRRGSGVSLTVRRTEAPRAERRSVRSTASGGAKSSQLLSGVPAGGAFYIYSFDGRLLAEYNILGGCVRDYVYFGGRLIAEYQTTGEDLYYYTSDQINSTRIVTDSTGTVVYAAAHDPYGGIQKTWEPITFDPSLKFSGKEHDEESGHDERSGLDYFGARYYDRAQYRFMSVDPVISASAAKFDPQRWNLYSYCGNNPINNIDPDGRMWIAFARYEKSIYVYDKNNRLAAIFPASDIGPGFPNGEWNFNQYFETKQNVSGSYGPWGYFSFNVDGNYNYSVHSGRQFQQDGWGGIGWMHATNGCIRTVPEAMLFMLWMHVEGGDLMTGIIVTDEWRVVSGSGPVLSPEERRGMRQAFELWCEGLACISNFLNDYFFTYGPIPPGALGNDI